MIVSKHFDLARMYVSSLGTGTMTLGATSPGFLSFADAGVKDGDTVTYAIEEGNNREVGRGVYTASGTTLTRNVFASTAGGTTPITLAGNAQAFITVAAEDLLLAQMSDIDRAVPLAKGHLLVYDNSPPVIVQQTNYDNANNSPAMALANAPTVGNTLVIIVAGMVSASCAGFDVVSVSGASSTICCILTRKVVAGDPAAWTVSTGVMSYLTTGVIMEIAGTFTIDKSTFTPTISGNSYTHNFTVDGSALTLGFFVSGSGGFQSCTATGATLLGQVSWFGAACAGVQIAASGTVSLNYSSTASGPVGFMVALTQAARWVPTTFADLVSAYTAGGGDISGTHYVKIIGLMLNTTAVIFHFENVTLYDGVATGHAVTATATLSSGGGNGAQASYTQIGTMDAGFVPAYIKLGTMGGINFTEITAFELTVFTSSDGGTTWTNAGQVTTTMTDIVSSPQALTTGGGGVGG